MALYRRRPSNADSVTTRVRCHEVLKSAERIKTCFIELPACCKASVIQRKPFLSGIQAPAQLSNMAATLNTSSLQRSVARSMPRRTAVRVQAYQVTMQTPSGCKKFELSAGKDLLEVGVERRGYSCPLYAIVITDCNGCYGRGGMMLTCCQRCIWQQHCAGHSVHAMVLAATPPLTPIPLPIVHM